MSGDATVRRRRWPAAVAGAVAGLIVAADALWPPPLDRAHDVSVTVADRHGAPLRVFTTADGHRRLPATVGDVDPLYVALLLAREDRRFFHHPGVDPIAVARALAQNLAAGRTVSGASTLTMQVARLLEPRPRTPLNKLIEAARALQLEARFSKAEILALHLTLAPFGGNLDGVRAGARGWFGKEAKALSAGEAALLVALPQAPSRLRPDRAPEAAREARARVLGRAVAAGVLDRRTAEEASAEPLPAAQHGWPLAAAHLAERLKRRHPGVPSLSTTLDGALQTAVEALVRREQSTLDERSSIAVIVADHRRGEVIAHVGGVDYLATARHGWIDMTRAVRSPGSALKPFIYGLALDDRLITPETIVADVSTRFGAYAPQNFDQAFHGELTVRDALRRSLNVPAVLLLDRLGPDRFANRLGRAGIALHLPEAGAAPGLPLALGGVGVTLEDLTMAYAALASGGRVRPLRVLAGSEDAFAPRRLVSPQAAAEVVDILAGAPPPPGMLQAGDRRPIAVKTGTSYGFRDAWAFGLGGAFTVGVWVGRADGSPSPDRLGRTTAAPILYRVFDLLPADPAPVVAATLPATPPPLLRRIEATEGLPRLPGRPEVDRLRLVFPRPASVIALSAADGDALSPLVLEAAGGRRPLTWLIDGRPVGRSVVDRTFLWQPARPGPARLAVIDQDGRSDVADVVVR